MLNTKTPVYDGKVYKSQSINQSVKLHLYRTSQTDQNAIQGALQSTVQTLLMHTNSNKI